HPPAGGWGSIRPQFYLGILLAALGGCLVTLYKPNPPAPRTKPAAVETAPVAGLDEFTEQCPFTTKQEIAEDQRAHPPYGTNLTFPLERYTRFHQTSGTTGAPLRWLDTPESWNWMVESWMEIFRAAGISASERVYFAFSFGPFIGFWLAFESASRLGCL